MKPQSQATQATFSYLSVGNTCTAPPLRLTYSHSLSDNLYIQPSLSRTQDTLYCGALHTLHTLEHI